MAWDFTADSDIQTEVATNIENYATQYEGKVAEMYGKIAEMGSAWVGDDYDLFVQGTDGYKTALQDLSNSMKMYSNHFKKLSKGTETLASNLIAIVNDLTGANGGGSAANIEVDAVSGADGGVPAEGGTTPGGDTGNPESTETPAGTETPGATETPAPTETPAGGGQTPTPTPAPTETPAPTAHAWTSYEDAHAAGCEVLTAEEFSRRKTNGSSEYEQYENYQAYLDAMHDKFVGKVPSGEVPSATVEEDVYQQQAVDENGEVVPEPEPTPEPAPTPAPGPAPGGTPTPGPTSGSSDELRVEYKSGDPVTINGTNYNVYGFVKDQTGKGMAIYEGADGYLYYLDKNGNPQNVQAKVSTIDAVTSNRTDSVVNARVDSLSPKLDEFGNSTWSEQIMINGVPYQNGTIASTGLTSGQVISNPSGNHTSYNGVVNSRIQESTYIPMRSSSNGQHVELANGSGTLCVPNSYSDIQQAARNNQPIMITNGHVLNYDGFADDNRLYGTNGDVYLVYRNNYYYVSDSNGNILDYDNPINKGTLIGDGIFNNTTFK